MNSRTVVGDLSEFVPYGFHCGPKRAAVAGNGPKQWSLGMKQIGNDAPLEIVRYKDLSRYIPVGKTRRDALIKDGHLEVVSLTPRTKAGEPGRAKGITMRSIRQYQATVMGIPHALPAGSR